MNPKKYISFILLYIDVVIPFINTCFIFVSQGKLVKIVLHCATLYDMLVTV